VFGAAVNVHLGTFVARAVSTHVCESTIALAALQRQLRIPQVGRIEEHKTSQLEHS
jgi:hypothetical protein